MGRTISLFAHKRAARIIGGRQRIPVSLLRSSERVYAFTFYVMYRCATSFGNQEWGEGNAVFAMGLLQFMLLSEVVCGIALLTGHTPLVPSKAAVLLGLTAILMFTYFLLVRKHQWLRYKPTFETYSRKKHFLASLGVGLLVAVAFLGIGIVKQAIGAVHS
jgi:uncharacterized membrane protein YphA (DoxX/SURF4 family)